MVGRRLVGQVPARAVSGGCDRGDGHDAEGRREPHRANMPL
jgi:hypothetical protein